MRLLIKHKNTYHFQSILREGVKEKFKYAVDRSSPSNKLREFMDWSKDIMQDIKYTRKIYSYFILRFFTKYWWVFVLEF